MNTISRSVPPTRIGFVGLGIMGVPLVQRFLEKGLSVTVWNLEPERFALVQDAGAVWVDSPAAVCTTSEVVFVCVLGDDALASVCLGEHGFVQAKGASLLVDFSTSSPAATLRVAAQLQEATGLVWLDAPMSGGPQAAREGKLTLLVGGDSKVYEQAKSLLSLVSSNLTRMGGLGSGQKTKILNQVLVGVNYVLMAELLTTAKAAGIDPHQLPECLKGGMADSTILQRIFPQMASGDFNPPKSYARQLNKDLKSVKVFVENLKLELPVVATAIQQYRNYTEAGNEMEDGASVSRLYEE